MSNQLKKDTKMMVYGNEFNRVSFKGFNRIESNILHVILAKARNRSSDTLVFDAKELIEVSEYSMDPTNVKRFGEYIFNMLTKITALEFKWYDTEVDDWVRAPLFKTTRYSGKEEKLYIEINEVIEHLFNNITSRFTSFETAEFLALKKKYSQPIYKILKQYKFLGRATITMEEVYEIIGVPKKYTAADITKKVINPSVEELSEYFLTLEVTPVKRGRIITGYEFTYLPEDRNNYINPRPVISVGDEALYDEELYEYVKSQTFLD